MRLFFNIHKLPNRNMKIKIALKYWEKLFKYFSNMRDIYIIYIYIILKRYLYYTCIIDMILSIVMA